jgi:hypothetical protein
MGWWTGDHMKEAKLDGLYKRSEHEGDEVDGRGGGLVVT